MKTTRNSSREDHLCRVKEHIRAFIARNNLSDMSGRVIHNEAMLTVKCMLAKNEREPHLGEKEMAALKKFKASSAWCSTMLRESKTIIMNGNPHECGELFRDPDTVGVDTNELGVLKVNEKSASAYYHDTTSNEGNLVRSVPEGTVAMLMMTDDDSDEELGDWIWKSSRTAAKARAEAAKRAASNVPATQTSERLVCEKKTSGVTRSMPVHNECSSVSNDAELGQAAIHADNRIT